MAISGHTAAELMHAALHEHDREILALKSAHRLELEILHSTIANLRREQEDRDSRRNKSVGKAIEDVTTAEQRMPRSGLAEFISEKTEDKDDDGDNAMGAEMMGSTSLPAQKFSYRSRSLTNLVVKDMPDTDTSASGLRKFINGPFDDLVCAVIFLNSIFIFVQLQYLGYENAARAGLVNLTQPDEGAKTALVVIEHLFNAFFLLEVCVRIVALRCSFFKNKTTHKIEIINILDAFLVACSSCDLYLTSATDEASSINFTVFRPFRFFRLAKVIRAAMVVKMFHKLKVLMTTVGCSLMALFWSIVLIFGCLLAVALFANQLVALSLQDESISIERREWMFNMYGTSLRASWTLFELTFSGGFPGYARPLVEEVSGWWSIFFILHIVVVQFAMFRIVTALFLRDTLALAARDAETAVHDKLCVQERVQNKLLAFFEEADTSGDGMLSKQEFTAMLENPKVRAWLSLLEMDVHDAMQAFDLLLESGSSDRGTIDSDEFIKGMTRMKGLARSQDVLAIWHMEQKVLRDVSMMTRAVHQLQAMIDESRSVAL